MFAIRVNGGTGAGSKPAPGPHPEEWECACGQTHPGYQLRCWTSDERRPDQTWRPVHVRAPE